jgi:hypothetical protein
MTDPEPFDSGQQTFAIGEGDLEPALMQTLWWSDHTLVSELAEAVSVKFSMWVSPRGGLPKVDRATAQVEDGPNGIVK